VLVSVVGFFSRSFEQVFFVRHFQLRQGCLDRPWVSFVGLFCMCWSLLWVSFAGFLCSSLTAEAHVFLIDSGSFWLVSLVGLVERKVCQI